MRLARIILAALFLSEMLVLANGLLLVRLAKSLSTPINTDRNDAIRELPRSLTLKLSLPTIDPSLNGEFERNTHLPPLAVVGKWEIHAWIDDQRVTDSPVLVYDHTQTVASPPPIDWDKFSLTFDSACLETVDGEPFVTLPSQVSSFLGVKWTEKASTTFCIRALCRIELHPEFMETISRHKYAVSPSDLWNSVAEHRPEEDWSKWETLQLSEGKPNVRATLQPEAMRKSSRCLTPHVKLLQLFPVGSGLDVKNSVGQGIDRVWCAQDSSGYGVDCSQLYLELTVQLSTPEKAGDPPQLNILMWPATESAWPNT